MNPQLSPVTGHPSPALRGRRLAVYLFLCAVWGSTWLVIKIGLADLPPLTFAGLRMAAACLLLAPAALAKGLRRPNRREAKLIALSGVLQIGVSYAFVFVASQWIPSGLTALLFSSFPIWIGLFGHFLLPDEPFTRRALAAGVLGIAGVASIESPELRSVLAGGAGGPVLAGGLLVLGSAIVSSFANVLNKRSFAGVSPVFNVWAQTLVGGAFLLVVAVVFERGAPVRWTASALFSLAYLALLGTALAFAALFWLIPRVPVSVVGSIPLADTIVAVLLGRIVLGERLSGSALVGGALILAGVLLAVTPGRPPRRQSVS